MELRSVLVVFFPLITLFSQFPYVALYQQDRDLGDEYGWKQVHGDVFRPSSHPLIFSSLIGSGCQIFSVSLIVIIVAMVEDLYTEWVIEHFVMIVRFRWGLFLIWFLVAKLISVYWIPYQKSLSSLTYGFIKEQGLNHSAKIQIWNNQENMYCENAHFCVKLWKVALF